MKRCFFYSIILVLGYWHTSQGQGLIYANSPRVIGIEYSRVTRGQSITKQEVSSLENIHQLSFYFAPWEYLCLSGGCALDKFETETYAQLKFSGNYGPAPTAAISLFTPALAGGILRFTGGATFLYLNSKDKRGFQYHGPILGPTIGIGLAATRFVTFEFGGRMHWIRGNMQNTDTNEDFGPFSNNNNYRGYASLALRSPRDGSYLMFYFDASPGFKREWANGPVESTIGVSLGLLIRTDVKNEVIRKDTMKRFPNFEDMEEKARKAREEFEKEEIGQE